MPVLFPVQAPRDVLADTPQSCDSFFLQVKRSQGGLWSGIKCVLGGVLVGLAGLIAQPIEARLMRLMSHRLSAQCDAAATMYIQCISLCVCCV